MTVWMVMLTGWIAAADLGEVEALIDRGELDAASRALDESDAPPGLVVRLRGAIALQRGELARAASFLERALEAYPSDPATSLYLAHVYVELGRAEAAEPLLPAVEALEIVAADLVRARVERALGHDDRAYAILVAAERRSPEAVAPILELAALSSELGLRIELRRWVARAAERAALTEDEALALIDVAYQDPDSRPTLERLVARFPASGELRGHLAHAYAAAGDRYAAGQLFELATRLGASYAFEAADQYRVVGRYDDALRMNARVADPARQLLQRVAILFTARRMGRVVAMESELRRTGLFEPRERYRVAYASYAIGNYQHALDLARTLNDTQWRSSAQSLIDAVGRLR